MEQSIHQSEEKLELYALGRLPASEVELVEEHLLTCQFCLDNLEETGAFADSVREALRELHSAIQDEKKPWFSWLMQPRLAMAGGFAAVLITAGIFWPNASRLPAMATLQLTAMRGDMQNVRQAKALDLTFTDAPATGSPFQAELVDGSGSPVWTGLAASVSNHVEAKIQRRLTPGDYFLRLHDASGKVLHEYGFHITD